MSVTVGVDMSLISPGLALKRSDDDIIHMMGFQQRITDMEIIDHEMTPTLHVSRLGYPVKIKDRWVRSAHVVKTIITWIKSFMKSNDEKVHLYIENYALGMAGSSSVSKLCELGGILRHYISENKWSFSELSPGTIKKFFSGNGRASKSEMIEAYREKHGYPMLNDLFKIKDLQHPQEDMVDAIAILLTGLSGVKPKKPKKRKIKKLSEKDEKPNEPKKRKIKKLSDVASCDYM